MKDQEEGGRGTAGGRGAGAGAAEQDMVNAAMYARRFQCGAKEVHAFAMGCRRANDGIGSMCSCQEHEMDLGEEIYFYNGSGKNLPTAYCANMECFLGELHESTIFHACGKQLISGMMVCQTCSYKSDIKGGMAQCKAEGHTIKEYRTKREYEKAHAQDAEEESHTYHAHQILQNQKFATLWDTEALLYFENGVYLDHGEVLVKMLTEKAVENCTTHMRTEVTNTIKANTVVKRERFDAVPGVINVRNGLLRLDGMEFMQHDPTHLSRIQLNAKYDPDAVAGRFAQFMEEVIPDDEDRTTLMEVVSTALLGRQVNLEKIVMFLGEGHNGKSTLLEVIADVMGQDNISHVSIHQIIEERFARAELDGKLMNIYADISGNEITNLGVIKSLVTGEPVMAEYKGQPIFVLRNQAKLVFSCNRLPDIREDSDAVFRRFIIINFPVQFDDSSDNPNLKNELTTEEEKSGILNIMIESLRRVIDNGNKLTHAKPIDSMRDMWRTQSDHIKRFTNDCLKRASGSNEDKDDVYQAYVTYCRLVKEVPGDKQKFSRRMSSLGFKYTKARVRGKAVNAWLDVQIDMPEGIGGSSEGDGGRSSGGVKGGSGGLSSEGGSSEAGSGEGGARCDLGTLKIGTGGKDSGGGHEAQRPGGREGIVMDVLEQLCRGDGVGGGGGMARHAELVEELAKTGLFPSGRIADEVIKRLVVSGWIVDSGGENGESKGEALPAASTAASTAASPPTPPAVDDKPERKFRCASCPAGPFAANEVGFGGKRLIDYHTGPEHRIEWVD